MALVKVLDKYDLQNEFRGYDRDYFSLEGYQWLLDLFEECDCGNNTDLDVIAICCDFSEDEPLTIYNDYNNLDDVAECMNDDDELDVEQLLAVLNYHTIATLLDNGSIIYQNF